MRVGWYRRDEKGRLMGGTDGWDRLWVIKQISSSKVDVGWHFPVVTE